MIMVPFMRMLPVRVVERYGIPLVGILLPVRGVGGKSIGRGKGDEFLPLDNANLVNYLPSGLSKILPSPAGRPTSHCTRMA